MWRAGIYARLSADSHGRKNESIESQIWIAKEYISRSDSIVLSGCYTDLGKTGTDFDRAGFGRMMEDARLQKINCIIVKDFSRLGRNFTETGNYIEKVFPSMGIRFISVTDRFDSLQNDREDAGLLMNLKNMVNELYARDISEKVRTAKRVRQERGSRTGGALPYGYCSAADGSQKLLRPDRKTKDVAAEIFERFAAGDTYREIARELYRRKIQPPAQYRATGQVYCRTEAGLKYWNTGTIKRILANPVYGSAQSSCLQETVISRELFEKVSDRFEKQRKYANNRISAAGREEDTFRGLLYCGVCGGRMLRTSEIRNPAAGRSVRRYDYFCPNRKREERACTGEGISLRKLQRLAEAVLKREFALAGIQPGVYGDICERAAEKKKKELEKGIKKIRWRLEQIEGRKCDLYFAYREGRAERERYVTEKEKLENTENRIRKQLALYEEQFCRLEREKEKLLRLFDEPLFGCSDKSRNGELLRYLIRRIQIGPCGQAEIILCYGKKVAAEEGKNGA